jgi:flagellar protein FlbD
VIKLTHINGQEFVLNAEMIQYVEAKPDTIITLSTKERLIVKENVDEVVARVIEYGRALRTFPPERI